MKGFIVAATFVLASKLALGQVCIEIETLPSKTPAKDTIFLASSINKWNPCDKSYMFILNSKGKLSLTINSSVDSFEYKLAVS